MRWLSLVLALVTLWAVPVRAEDFDYQKMARDLGVSEVRAGIFLHDIELNGGTPLSFTEDSIDFGKWQNLSVDVLFKLPDATMIKWLGAPRIMVGGTLNFVGKESYARLAAIWHIPVFETGIFVEPMMGGGVHSGYLTNAPAGQRDMGCRFLYFYGANAGYEISEQMSVMISAEHMSHWGQCSRVENDGVNRLGLKLGWKIN